jgi:hypothetical protein
LIDDLPVNPVVRADELKIVKRSRRTVLGSAPLSRSQDCDLAVAE